MPISTRLLHDLCNLPTAAFREDAVIAYVETWAKKRSQIKLLKDRWGNRLLTLKGSKPRLPRLVLVAHMDHPAFVVQNYEDGRIFAEFRGGVSADHCEGARVRFFDEEGIERAIRIGETVAGERGRLTGAWFKSRQPIEQGTIGMFDAGSSRESRGLFHSRACDDLAGVASALTALDQLRRKPPESTVCVLLTRAEEIGFIGAISAVKEGKLLKADDRIISIETSMEQPVAQIGKGVVLRVGDYTSVFHSGLSYFLAQRSEELAKRNKSFAFQRALMPGGTCEGTVFDAFGHIASAVCVALGNYHNMDRAKKQVGAEYISIDDWRNMVELFADVARKLHEFSGNQQALQKRLTNRFESNRHLYESPRASLGGLW